MNQIASSATMEDCRALGVRPYLLHDRNTNFNRSLRAILMSG